MNLEQQIYSRLNALEVETRKTNLLVKQLAQQYPLALAFIQPLTIAENIFKATREEFQKGRQMRIK